MSSLFIADGYTLDGKINAHKGTPEIKFRYRPALPEQVAEYFFNHNRAANGKEQINVVIDLIEKQVISWNATNKKPDGSEESVPVKLEWLSKVPFPILYELRDEILSYGTGGAAGKDEKN